MSFIMGFAPEMGNAGEGEVRGIYGFAVPQWESTRYWAEEKWR
jgi:hypothetical protein